MGVKSLRKIQLGQEGTPGSAVAATTLWRGMGVVNDAQELQFVEEDIGVLAQPDSSYISKLDAGFDFEEVDATYEQLPYILAAGVKNVVTGTQDGTGAGYIYEYPMPMASANTIKTFTMEGGDDEGCEEVEYCFVREFSISGAAGEAVKMSASWEGRQATPTTFTGAISVPATEVILFNRGKFYIDDADGTAEFGDTRVESTLLSFELSISTGWLARWTCDEELYFNFLRATRPEVSLTLNMEHNATSIAEKAAMRATGGEARLIRLIFEGSSFTAGDDYDCKTLIIDAVVKYTSVPALDDEDGDNVLNFEGSVIWVEDAESTPADGFLKFTVVNKNTSLA